MSRYKKLSKTREYLKALRYAESKIESELINFNGALALASVVVKINGEEFKSRAAIQKRIANVKNHLRDSLST